jgi:hypothetical protein
MYDTLAIKDYYIAGGDVFRAFHGLPSGVKSTSLLGSIINLISLIYCAGPKNSKEFNFVVGGDDFLVSFKKENLYDPEFIKLRMTEKAKELGMNFKFLDIKQYNSAEIEDCPSFYKYTIYKGKPAVQTSAILERVFMPWNKSYNTDNQVLKFLVDVMPSLGTPMSHHLLYYEYYMYIHFKIFGYSPTLNYMVSWHQRVFDKMMSRKLSNVLFKYKNSRMSSKATDVATSLFFAKRDMRYNKTPFSTEVLKNFKYLF